MAEGDFAVLQKSLLIGQDYMLDKGTDLTYNHDDLTSFKMI